MKMRFWCYLALVGMFVLSYAAVAAIVSLFTQDPTIIQWSGRAVSVFSTLALYIHFQFVAEAEMRAELRRDLDF